MRKRLFAVAATALLPAIGLLAYNELASRQQREAEIHAQASQAVRQAASEADQILEGARSLLIAASVIPGVAELDAPACTASLSRVTENLTMTGAILVIGRDGKLVCDSHGSSPGIDFSDRAYVMDALTSQALVVGNYTVSKITGVAVLPVSIPLRQAGETVGVIATGIRLDWLQRRIAERGVSGEGGAVTLADRDGTILARQPLPERFVGSKIPPAYLHLIGASAPGTMDIVSQDGTERIMGFRPVTPASPIYVSAGLSKREAFATVNRVTLTGLTMLILSALLAVVAAFYVGDRFILRPIYCIVDVLEDWKRGDRNTRTRMAGRHGELGLVGSSVDSLLDELEVRQTAAAVAEDRRELLARELAHRVKNTLAIVGAMARQSFKAEGESYEVFSRRLTALGRTYDLLLTGDGPGGDIGAIIASTVMPYETSDSRRFRNSGPQCPLDSDTGLALSLIIHEMATNAVKYGALSVPDGFVEIVWCVQDDRLCLAWDEHKGPPVKPPARDGFGSRLIRRAFPSRHNPELAVTYAPEGLNMRLTFDYQAESRA